MKRAQLIGITIAGGAGLAAFLLMRSITSGPSEPTQVGVPVNATEVLVAARDLSMGDITKGTDFRWQTWPANSVTPTFITKEEGNNGHDLGNGRSGPLADHAWRAHRAAEAHQGG